MDIGRHRRSGRSRHKLESNSTFDSFVQRRSRVQRAGESCREESRTPETWGSRQRWKCRIDSSAAKSTASRIGVGKMRHIHTKLFRIQEAVRDGRIKLTKISGGHNPADVLSKPMSVSEMTGQLQSVGIDILSRKLRWADLVDEEQYDT